MTRPVVHRRARLHADRNGDPLEGLVNLFDLGIVLAVAFLLAALTATRSTAVKPPTPAVPTSTPQPLVTSTQRVTGPGTRVGGVYRLPNGQLVYVPDASSSARP